MLQTFRAILTRSQIRWEGESPKSERPVHVHVTILDEATEKEVARGDAMAAVLDQLADQGGISSIENPIEWQRDSRADRSLPGREQ